MPRVDGRTSIQLTPPEPRLLGVLDGLVGQLKGYVPAALREFDVTAVHQARVCTRRLSAALELLEPLVSTSDHREMRKALRKLRRRLGPHRDLDVLIEHLGEIEMPAAADLAGVLNQRRDALRRETLEEVRVEKAVARLGIWDSVRIDLREAGERMITPLLTDGVHADFDEFATLADLLAHQVLESPSGGGGGSGLLGIDPHELRIAGKKLRYALELTESAQASPPVEAESESISPLAPAIKRFKKLQDALGEWHDKLVLAETAVAVVADLQLTHRDAPRAARLMGLAAGALDKSWEHLREFGRLWHEAAGPLSAAVSQALPLTHPMAVHPEEWPTKAASPKPRKRKPIPQVEKGAETAKQGAPHDSESPLESFRIATSGDSPTAE
jgi:CHAD domain-containing protein